MQIRWKNSISPCDSIDYYMLKKFEGYEDNNLDNIKYAFYSGYKETKYIVTEKGDIFHCIPQYNLLKKVRYWNCKGYLKTSVTNEHGKTYQFFVHRMIAFAFLPNSENKAEVNHINGNKQDNRVQNLEWCTRAENEQHKYKLGYKVSEETKEKIRKANSGKNCWRAKKVMCLETGEIFDTAKQASFHLKMSQNVVSQACKSGKAIKNTHWKYV